MNAHRHIRCVSRDAAPGWRVRINGRIPDIIAGDIEVRCYHVSSGSEGEPGVVWKRDRRNDVIGIVAVPDPALHAVRLDLSGMSGLPGMTSDRPGTC